MDVDQGRLVLNLPPITQIDAGHIHTVVGFLPSRNEDRERPDRREYLVPAHGERVQSTHPAANEFLDRQDKIRDFQQRSQYIRWPNAGGVPVSPEPQRPQQQGKPLQGFLAINSVSVPCVAIKPRELCRLTMTALSAK